MSATSHLRDPDSGELIPLPYHNGGYSVQDYEYSREVCPECSEHFPEGTDFEYVEQADEYVCHECAAELRGIDK